LPPIWLPPSYVALQALMKRSGILTWLTWSDLGGGGASLQRLQEIVAQLPTTTLLQLVGMASVLEGNRPIGAEEQRKQQAGDVGELLAPELVDHARELILTGRRDVLLHEEQLLAVARLAILHGQQGPAVGIDAGRKALISELLLGVNELLVLDQSGKAEADELAVMLALRRLAGVTNDQARYAIPRWFDLLVTRSRSYSAEPPKLDLDAAFREAISLTIDEYLGFAFAYVGPFTDMATVQDLAKKNFIGVAAAFEKQFKDPALASKAQSLFTGSVDDFKAMLPTTADLARVSLLPFKERPLVRLGDGAVIPMSIRLTIQKVATGVYWTLHDYYRRTDPQNGVRTFTKYVGQLHQGYVSWVLRRTYSSPYAGTARFADEQAVIEASPSAPKGQKPPFDAALIEGDSLVLIEIGTPVFSLRAAEAADLELYRVEIEKFKQKARQLEEAISGVANGTWVVPGLELQRVRHIMPVLVLLHPFVTVPPIMATLEGQIHIGLRAFGTKLAAAEVHSPQVLSDEEIEMLEPFLVDGTLNLPELFRKKLSASDSKVAPMKTFLLNFLGVTERTNKHMEPLWKAFTEAIKKVLGANLRDFYVEEPPKAGG
jgi:hypothetical protein